MHMSSAQSAQNPSVSQSSSLSSLAQQHELRQARTSSSNMDPLSALHDFTIRGELEKIVRVNDEFRFDSDYSFPCHAETATMSSTPTTSRAPAAWGSPPSLSLTASPSSTTSPERSPLPNVNSGINNDSNDYGTTNSRIFSQIETPVDYMSLICSGERPLKDREGLLECKGRNFYGLTKKCEKCIPQFKIQRRKKK